MILKRKHSSQRESKVNREQTANNIAKKNSFTIRVAYLVVLGALLIGNIFMFASSVKISDQITYIETKIEGVRKENSEIQQKILAENSLQTLEFIAKQTGYTKEAEPYYLGETGYAMAQ
jgi:cell division protein FtsL